MTGKLSDTRRDFGSGASRSFALTNCVYLCMLRVCMRMERPLDFSTYSSPSRFKQRWHMEDMTYRIDLINLTPKPDNVGNSSRPTAWSMINCVTCPKQPVVEFEVSVRSQPLSDVSDICETQANV